MSELRRELRLLDAVSLVVGTIIGSGIFASPNLVARALPSDSGIIAAWVFAGVLSFFGALAFAELGAMLPATGGQYVYIREAFGPLLAFLKGWAALLIIYTGAAAWLSVTFSMFLGRFVTLDPWQSKAVSILFLAVITAINYRGLRAGAMVQDVLTVLKVGGLAFLIAAAYFAPAHPAAPEAPFTLPAFGIALIACLLTYDGWVAVSFVAGEIRDPQRTIPRALMIGIGVAVLLYVGANVAYLHVLTPLETGQSQRVASDVMQRALGDWGGSALSVVILFSIAGAANGWMLSTPRIYYAMALDGLFFRRLGTVHPRFGTPGPAILLQGAWAALLVLTGTYESLGAYAMFAAWTFYGIAVSGLIVLRRRQPGRPRPYRMWGYPFTPALFVLTAAAFLLNTLIEAPGPAFAALGLIGAGVPVYWIWTSKSRISPVATSR